MTRMLVLLVTMSTVPVWAEDLPQLCYVDDQGVVRRGESYIGSPCADYRQAVAERSRHRIGGRDGAWLLCYALDPVCGAILRAHLPIPTNETYWLYYDTQERGYP